MKRIALGRPASARITALKRSSKSPRKRVPARSAPVSSAKISAPFSFSCTSSPSRRAASPSAIAVLPTPASPTNTGLFLRRRQRTSIVRCSSSARPISGSSSPCRARSVRLTQYAASGSREVVDSSSPAPAFAPASRSASPSCGGGVFVTPCEMYSRMSSRVIPCSASSRAACVFGCCMIAARMSPAFASSRCAACTCRIAVCSTWRNAAVCSGSSPLPRGTRSTDVSRYALRSRRSLSRSAPHAVRIRSPSGSCDRT